MSVPTQQPLNINNEFVFQQAQRIRNLIDFNEAVPAVLEWFKNMNHIAEVNHLATIEALAKNEIPLNLDAALEKGLFSIDEVNGLIESCNIFNRNLGAVLQHIQHYTQTAQSYRTTLQQYQANLEALKNEYR